MQLRRRIAFAVGAVAMAATAAVAIPATSAATTPPQVYVAMGDSYTAGPLILPMTDNFTCARSALNYPALLAAQLHVQTFRDVSCSSAVSADFSNPQPGVVSGTNPPQYNAITSDTTLVTIGIGGNDIGLVGLAESCINILPAPFGKSCAAKYTAGGVDVYSQKIAAFASTYGTIIEHVRSLAPAARIVLVGYPTVIRNGGCFPLQPLLGPDATYVMAKVSELDIAMKQQAALHGATFVDLRPSSVGHDACALPGIRWIEGLVPTSAAFPLHPNVLSMKNAARVISAAL